MCCNYSAKSLIILSSVTRSPVFYQTEISFIYSQISNQFCFFLKFERKLCEFVVLLHFMCYLFEIRIRNVVVVESLEYESADSVVFCDSQSQSVFVYFVVVHESSAGQSCNCRNRHASHSAILLRDEAIAKLKTILWSRFRATLIFMLTKGGSEPSPRHFETVLFYRKSKSKQITGKLSWSTLIRKLWPRLKRIGCAVKSNAVRNCKCLPGSNYFFLKGINENLFFVLHRYLLNLNRSSADAPEPSKEAIADKWVEWESKSLQVSYLEDGIAVVCNLYLGE